MTISQTDSRRLTDDLSDARRTREQFEELLANPARIGPDFEPIRDLRDDSLVGVKASARGWAGTEFSDRAGMARVARALGLIERVDWTYMCRSFDVAIESAVTVPVHITPEPESLGTICPPRLTVSFNRGKRELDVVMELRLDLYEDGQALRRCVDEYRSWGWRIAVPDYADDPRHMQTVRTLRPEIVHLDMALPGRTPAEPSRSVRDLLALAEDCGSHVLAMNVDTPKRRDDALELGATVGRGLLFGMPGPLPSS
jgi:EAL domain-containing protein (putative c-di-GMP-specific phosphodiesterase class I)